MKSQKCLEQNDFVNGFWEKFIKFWNYFIQIENFLPCLFFKNCFHIKIAAQINIIRSQHICSCLFTLDIFIPKSMHCRRYLKTSEWTYTLFMNSEANTNWKRTYQPPKQRSDIYGSVFIAFWVRNPQRNAK